MSPAQSDPIAAVELIGVTKRFAGTLAVNEVGSSIMPGRLTGLIGPDGAGKTTLMRLMAGLMMPSSGRVRVFGHDTRTESEQIPGLIGYMPQRFGLYEDLSVLENLRLYAELRGLPASARQETFARLLRFTRLEPFVARLAGRLSGGMKQKLGLACALISAPGLLLLDEPGVGVDPVSRQDLWRIVSHLTASGVAVVWATAYLDEAERCDSVMLLDQGGVAYEGTPAALTAKLADRTFRIPEPEGDRRMLLSRALASTSVCDGAIEGDALRIVLRAGAESDDIAHLAANANAVLEPVAPRFEDAFIDLLGGAPCASSALAEHMEPVRLEVEHAVECQALTRRFGEFTAASDVSFAVAQGEIVGLLGPNGAGKSTTFKMLCGLLKPSSGEARVAGVNLRSAASAAKSRLGYMAQKFSLYGLMSVRQNLEFAAGVYGLAGNEGRERIAEMIEILHLGRFLRHSPDELPLGYKQRLALACAVMHRPAVLFLDEPTSGVDPVTRREFWAHINGMVQKGVTVLVTTHFMDEAEYCDRVALMHEARVIALDTPDALKRRATRKGEAPPTMEETFIRLIEGERTSASTPSAALRS
ncbi:MAG: ATP-binding cassette domain-containing protein [Methylotetracoccus sp.]